MTRAQARPRPRRETTAAVGQPGHPRAGALVREGAAMALSQPVAAALVGLVAAAVCGVVLATTGQSAAAERDVLGRIDEAGTRLVVVTDTGGAELEPAVVDRVAALSGVEWVVGVGPVRDVRNAALGAGAAPVPARALHGDIPPALELRVGRWPAVGEAVVGPEARVRLGLDEATGGVSDGDSDVAVVGEFAAVDPLAFLSSGVLLAADPEDGEARVRALHVLAEGPEEVATVARAVRAVLDPADPMEVAVETSEALADVRSAVAGELGEFSRQLLLLVLGVGLVLIGLVVYGSVTMRRRDFGRRRALGASRSTVVVLVLLQTLAAAAVGTVVGTFVGLAAVQRLMDSLPAGQFVAGLGALTLLVALLAAVPPAVVAALRDPVRILRVP